MSANDGVLVGAKRMIDSIIEKVVNNQHPSFELVATKKSKKSTTFAFNHHSRIKRIACTLRVLDVALRRSGQMTRRDLFYMDTTLFGDQLHVDLAVVTLAATFGVGRDSLGISAGITGLVYGELSVGGLCCTKQVQIARTPEKGLNPEIAPEIVLIVEKEAIFNALVHCFEDIKEQLGHTLLLVTGRGYPCLGTLRFVHWLSQTISPTSNFFILVDYDPYGLDIAMNYKCGTKHIQDQADTCCATLKFLGVKRTHLDAVHADGPDHSRHPINQRGKLTAKRVIAAAGQIGWADVSICASELLAGGFGTEIEAIYNESDKGNGLISWISSQLRNALGEFM